jgi:plasmid maintenance system killer protein
LQNAVPESIIGVQVATVRIESKDLRVLYETGRSRKFDLPPQVLRKFYMRIQTLEATERVADLLADKGMHFERYKDRYSIRLNDQYRLEFDVGWLDADQTQLGIVDILDVSAHYGD